MSSPEDIFLLWFNQLPPMQRCTLAHLYVIMTSSDSGDFALTELEALSRFEAIMQEPEFPVRRVARLLAIRGVFNFIFANVSFLVGYVESRPALLSGDSIALAPHQWKRVATRWKCLTAGDLSDGALHGWLASL